MKRKFLILFFAIIFNIISYSEIKTELSEYNFKIYNTEFKDKILFFSKADSKMYNHMRIKNSNENNFKLDLKHFIKLLIYAEKEINLELKYISLPSLLGYNDLLKRYIESYIKENKYNEIELKSINYKLIRKVLLEYNIYYLEDILKEKDYKIKEFNTEKHGYLKKDKLIELGFKGNERVVLPFLVVATIEKNDKSSK